ncbi:hypothetical protein ACLOJK_014757 [Asimina triloba]
MDTLLLISIWGPRPLLPAAHCLGKRMDSVEMDDACCPRDLKSVLLLLPGSVLPMNVVCCRDGADGGADQVGHRDRWMGCYGPWTWMGFAALDHRMTAKDRDAELMYI